MTALAMIIGMAPMALGLGEGGEQNAPLGRAVIGGLIFAGLLKVPVPEECEALSAWYAMMQERPSVENRITMSEPDMASG